MNEFSCKRCGLKTFLKLCPNCLGNSETGEGPLTTSGPFVAIPPDYHDKPSGVSEVQLQTIREQVLDACVKEMIARHAPLSLSDIPTILADQVLTIVVAVIEGSDA